MQREGKKNRRKENHRLLAEAQRHKSEADEELAFIINYDIKYRMGREVGEEVEEEHS